MSYESNNGRLDSEQPFVLTFNHDMPPDFVVEGMDSHEGGVQMYRKGDCAKTGPTLLEDRGVLYVDRNQ